VSGGILSVILGALIASRPAIGARVLATWIDAYALFSGIARSSSRSASGSGRTSTPAMD
jgi:uncharacterized membrane protein HdeD (DUF308 family)